jgi:hypothetical protein
MHGDSASPRAGENPRLHAQDFLRKRIELHDLGRDDFDRLAALFQSLDHLRKIFLDALRCDVTGLRANRALDAVPSDIRNEIRSVVRAQLVEWLAERDDLRRCRRCGGRG